MKKKLTAEQRKQIVVLLREGLDRASISVSVGVTPGQVAAVAAHLTMKTYADDAMKNLPDESAVSQRGVTKSDPAKSSARISSKSAVSVLIGQNVDTGGSQFWEPTPQSGTPNPHLLIVGESGSGKTFATQCICAELIQQNLPTIVFDFGQGFGLAGSPPEFIKYARPIEINVGTDGININPLQIFPSDIHGPVNVAQRIADTFARVYPAIGVQQHAALRDAILQCFVDVGIDPNSKKTWASKPPRFSDLKLTLEEIAQDTSNPARRIVSAVASHISTVFVFNTFRATGLDLDWQQILSSTAHTYIVQLKGLEHLLERVTTELLLWNLIGYIESIGPGPLRCMILLDEAHRLSFASNSPVEKLLREGRKFGLGVVLASQQPEDFSPVAFTNTASKLVFNVTDDRGTVARQIARKSPAGSGFLSLVRRLGSLRRGQACFLARDTAALVEVTDFVQRARTWH